MANHIQSILSQWYPERDACRWVLGTVVDIQGSNYRREGAMLLANEFGQYIGLISGGCLEKSLMLEVKKTLAFNQPHYVTYDSTQDSDSPWARALGCGGIVTILLQPVNSGNDYQQLDQLYTALQERAPVDYGVNLPSKVERDETRETSLANKPSNYVLNKTLSSTNKLSNKVSGGSSLLVIPVQPQTHLLVFGGGIDAIPLVQMAGILGWQITLIDKRSGYAQPEQFAGVQTFLSTSASSPEVRERLRHIDAAIVMTHNVDMDVEAIQVLKESTARYIGLLGPSHRKQKVLNLAGIETQSLPLYGPMGLPLGGDLPESIALATLAECHQILEGCASAKTITTQTSNEKVDQHKNTLQVSEA